MRFCRRGWPVLGILCLFGACGLTCAPSARMVVAEVPVTQRAVRSDERWLVGVWTWAGESQEAARWSPDAVRFAEDGTHTRGRLQAGRYVAKPHSGSTPGFVSRWELKGNRIYFCLDGAEEAAGIVRVGENVFRTEFFDGNVQYVFWYVRHTGGR